jgi:hypothetical protein
MHTHLIPALLFRGLNMLNKIVRHPAYVFFVMFLILPINGALIERGEHALGIVLASLQIPWFLFHVLPVLMEQY